MGKKTDLSLQAIAGLYGSAQPPGKMGFDALRGRLPADIPAYQPAALQQMPLPEDWERGGVQTVYFPVSDAIAGTLGYGVEKATGSPTAGFAAELMAPSPTSLAKELAKVVRGGGDDARKIFAGVGAKTANLPKRAEAEQMLAAGADPAQVWRDTGWAVGPDKKWRFEIPDNAATVKGAEVYPSYATYDKLAQESYGVNYGRLPFNADGGLGLERQNIVRKAQSLINPNADKISGNVTHEQLFNAYPETADIPYSWSVGGESGAFSGQGGIQATAAEGALKSPTLHELQHAVQEREGFARGGSPEQFNQQQTAELARDALSFRRELLKKRESMPNADWMHVENAVVDDYYKMGAPDWLPSREARDLARQPNVLFPDKYPNSEEGFNDLTELVKAYGLDKNVTPYKSMDMYKRLAGEAESRLVQSRLNMTPEQLRAQYPYDPAYFEEATGVKLSDLILRGEGGAAASVARQTAAPFTLGGIADEIPATVPETAGRVIDDNTLRSLRAKATDIEDAARGISVYVTQDGQAIVSKPKSVKTPERIKKFASENNLTYSESQWRMPVSEKYPLHSEPMPTEYRESGAKYWWE